jgi:hypothetical protein
MTPLKTALGIVFIICLTIVIFTFITRGRLCEFSIKGEHQEVAAKLACNAGNLYGRNNGSARLAGC